MLAVLCSLNIQLLVSLRTGLFLRTLEKAMEVYPANDVSVINHFHLCHVLQLKTDARLKKKVATTTID